MMLSVANVQKNTRELNFGDPHIPFYVLQDGQLVPDEITRATPPPNPWRLYWKNRVSDWMNRSTLLSLFNEASNKAIEGLQKQRQALEDGLKKTTSVAAAPAPALPDGYVGSRRTYVPDLPETQKAWAIGEAFLDLMRQDCSAHGAEFWIVTDDSDVQSNPSLAERASFLSEMHIPSLAASDQRVRRFADAHGIPVLLLAPPMGDYAAAHGVALHGFPATPFNSDPWPINTGHWNELGHELVGAMIAQSLLQRSSVIRLWTSSSATDPNLLPDHILEVNK
jgi:hypothetical protein